MPIPQLIKKRNSIYSPSQKKQPPKKNIRKIISNLITILIFLALGGGLFFALFVLWVSKDLPDPNRLIERVVPLSTTIYNKTGKTVLYEVHGEKRRSMAELKDLPEYIKWATISVEDKNFYQHQGFDFLRIIKATLVNLIQRGKYQGASTITQQLIKNAILSPEKTYSRKIKELILSWQMERKFTKDEILKMYLNEIPYGSTAYGIESAAKNYFGKSARELTLAEAATLAALPKAPTYYSPHGNHKEELISRQKMILDLMAKYGYIKQEEAEAAKKETLNFKAPGENIIAPHFVMYVKELLAEKYSEKTVEEGGFKVTTTLDLDKQRLAEEIIKEKVVDNEKKFNATNAALVSLDPKTGQILAMVGSRDYFDEKHDGNVNVTLRPRQPGSSFKPLAYAMAFKKGFTPETLLFDVVTNFAVAGAKDYIPHNYDDKERGPVTMRQALAGSLNIPAVKTLYLAGVNNVLDQAEKMGYSTFSDRSRFGLSLVLGGAEVKLLEHTDAYSVFAREGYYQKPVAILKIEDSTGKVIEEYKKTAPAQVLDTQVCRQINNILSDNSARAFIFGENNYLTLPDRPVGAKTGTTNDYRDAWTIGYTPSLVTGVWVGNNDNSEMKRGADGSKVAAPIWQAFMKKVLTGTPVETFNPPEPTTVEKPILKGELPSNATVKIDKASGKLATELTPPTFIEERRFKEVHCLLYYVNKDDPQGPPPESPVIDPQYPRWEEAVQKWAKERGFDKTESPPTEYDNLHTKENQPQIKITYPLINQTLTNDEITLGAEATAPRGVKRIEYYFDEKLIAESVSAPFSYNYIISGFDNGSRVLKAVAYDDIDNTGTDWITVNFALPEIPIDFKILKPVNNSSFGKNDFPLTISASVNYLNKIQKINFFYQKNDDANSYLIATVIQPQQKNFTLNWQTPPQMSGSYQLFAEIIQNNNQSVYSEKVNLNIQ
ncbi:MAG: PBP1A family penicillin-binding protein [bacterium]